MKEELYKKVYINSEADLPKEGQCCICHLIDEDEIIETAIFQSVHTQSWFNNVDWYLQPIEPVEAEKETIVIVDIDVFVNEESSPAKEHKHPECKDCSYQNSENCNTCDILNPQFR